MPGEKSPSRNHGRTKVVHNTQQEEIESEALSMQSSRGLSRKSNSEDKTRYGARRQSSLAATLPGDMLNERQMRREELAQKQSVRKLVRDQKLEKWLHGHGKAGTGHLKRAEHLRKMDAWFNFWTVMEVGRLELMNWRILWCHWPRFREIRGPSWWRNSILLEGLNFEDFVVMMGVRKRTSRRSFQRV